MIDTAELSSILKDIILDYDEVALPGIGMFLAEDVPASFADNGYSINPPGRKLTFIQKLGADTLLLDRYCADAEDKDEARASLLSYLMELNRRIKEEKSIVLPGLGLMRATDDNLFFFVPEEHMDICPDSFGLEKVHLKAAGVKEEKFEEVPAQPLLEGPAQELAETPAEEEQAAEDVVAEECQEAAAEQADEAATELADEPAVPANEVEEDLYEEKNALHPHHLVPKIILGTVILAVVFILLLAILGRVAPDLVDKLLYSQQELEILNYPL